ncbi:hypothetical protein ACN20G_13655 [Streptomyces sp. BI20]|uniref:hypothetical protein n=1 Tax=Streptomyces sp. BI20 TaxID=3403460 RepID=UPI003C777D40
MTGLLPPPGTAHGPGPLAAAVLTEDNRLLLLALVALAGVGLALARTLYRRAPAGPADGAGRAAPAADPGDRLPALTALAVLGFWALFPLPADTWSERAGRSAFFLLGALFSVVTGYVAAGSAARPGPRPAGAAVVCALGLGVLGTSGAVLVYAADAPRVLTGYALGAALVAVFVRATGRTAGRVADLVESQAVLAVVALAAGQTVLGDLGLVLAPVCAAAGLLAAVLGAFLAPRGPLLWAVPCLLGPVGAVWSAAPARYAELRGIGSADLARAAGDPCVTVSAALALGLVLALLAGRLGTEAARAADRERRPLLTGLCAAVPLGLAGLLAPLLFDAPAALVPFAAALVGVGLGLGHGAFAAAGVRVPRLAGAVSLVGALALLGAYAAVVRTAWRATGRGEGAFDVLLDPTRIGNPVGAGLGLAAVLVSAWAAARPAGRRVWAAPALLGAALPLALGFGFGAGAPAWCAAAVLGCGVVAAVLGPGAGTGVRAGIGRVWGPFAKVLGLVALVIAPAAVWVGAGAPGGPAWVRWAVVGVAGAVALGAVVALVVGVRRGVDGGFGPVGGELGAGALWGPPAWAVPVPPAATWGGTGAAGSGWGVPAASDGRAVPVGVGDLTPGVPSVPAPAPAGDRDERPPLDTPDPGGVGAPTGPTPADSEAPQRD